jgi:hypothetical protein
MHPSVHASSFQPHTHHITPKLRHDNYTLWRFLITNFLEGHTLFRFVDGTNPRPPPKLLGATTSMADNPAFQTWYHQDKLVLSSIVSTLEEGVLPHILNLSSSRDVWLTLETLFSAHSQAHIVQTRYQLATMKKSSQTVADYFSKAQSLAHNLATIGQPFQESELVSYLLAGPSTDYDPLVTSVTVIIVMESS